MSAIQRLNNHYYLPLTLENFRFQYYEADLWRISRSHLFMIDYNLELNERRKLALLALLQNVLIKNRKVFNCDKDNRSVLLGV